MTLISQPGLFDIDEYRVGQPSKPRTERAPVSGIRWRRTALRRDCFTCWQMQHAEYDPNKPLGHVRKAAVAELQIWDDDGELSHHEFYCGPHAEKLGWDGSRSYDRRRRRNIDAEARQAVAFKLNRLIQAAKPGGYPLSFDDEVSDLLRKAGGHRLDMPEWTVTASGMLTGRFHGRVKDRVAEWAERFAADIESEPVTRFEHNVTATCRVLDSPAITVRVGGYTG